MEAAGYTLDIYCDTEGCEYPSILHNGATFYAQTYAQCKKAARAKGWRWAKREGETINLCPRCAETMKR